LSEDLEDAEERVFDAIEAAHAQYHVNPQRVFLAGAGCGGTMALRLAVNWPERFAGAASLGGGLPNARQTPLNQWTHVRRLPVFLGVGSLSEAYPPAHACNDLRLLRIAGLASITLRQYHPCPYPLIPHALHDVNGWIMEHVNAAASQTPRRNPRSSCLE
jgi:phospholipase/carboxylesterase